MKMDKRLLKHTGSVRKYLSLTVGMAVITALLTILQAFFLSGIINGVFLSGDGLAQVGFLLSALLVVIVGRAGIAWGSEFYANRIAGQVKNSLREKLSSHFLALGPNYTRGERSGELTNTMVEGVEALDAYFSQYLPQLFIVVLVPLTIMVTVFFLDPLSGLVLLLTAPLLPIFMILIGKAADALTKKQWKSMSFMSAHFLDVLQGLTTLKLFGRSQIQIETIGRISDQFRRTTLGVLKVAFLSALVMEIGATISTAIIAVEIGLRLLYGNIQFQPAFFVLLLAPEFYQPIRNLGARFHAGMSGAAASQRIHEILDTPLPASPAVTPDSVPPVFDTITFQNLSYSYNVGQRKALDNVSFTLEQGQRVALVGPSGSGKSTVAHLLLRFIEPQAGQILVGNISLNQVIAGEWRKLVGWVPQNPYLFNDTIAENIRLGKEDATEAEVIAAAKQANIHEFILSLPQGYATVIGEKGSRLSGGQAQRLSLARAFLKDSPLLILDEATSNLDPENEAQVLEATTRLMAGRTVLIIAHRMNTIIGSDKIIVLNEGKVVQSGTHRTLQTQSGVYSQLVGSGEGVK